MAKRLRATVTDDCGVDIDGPWPTCVRTLMSSVGVEMKKVVRPARAPAVKTMVRDGGVVDVCGEDEGEGKGKGKGNPLSALSELE
jgi:hypothetical protein